MTVHEYTKIDTKVNCMFYKNYNRPVPLDLLTLLDSFQILKKFTDYFGN